MKKLRFLIVLLFPALFAFGQNAGKQDISLIPEPVSMIRPVGNGSFRLPATVSLVVPKDPATKQIAEQFSRQVAAVTGYKLITKEGSAAIPGSIFIGLVEDKTIPDEGYRLKVTSKGVSLLAK